MQKINAEKYPQTYRKRTEIPVREEVEYLDYEVIDSDPDSPALHVIAGRAGLAVVYWMAVGAALLLLSTCFLVSWSVSQLSTVTTKGMSMSVSGLMSAAKDNSPSIMGDKKADTHGRGHVDIKTTVHAPSNVHVRVRTNVHINS